MTDRTPMASGRIDLISNLHGLMLEITTADALSVMPVTSEELHEMGRAFLAAANDAK